MSWTKLHSKIVYSSIWSETPETCKVWITLLALADQNGFVAASRSGIARIALLDQEDVDAALATLEGPDADSSDGTTGERIEKVEGGWIVLNHANYRDMQTRAQSLAARRAAAYRERRASQVSEDHAVRDASRSSRSSTVTGRDASDLFSSGNSESSEKEREHEGEEAKPKRARKPKVDAVERPPEVLQEHWDGWLKARAHRGAMPPTDLSLKAMRREAAAAGITLDDAVRLAAENGWQAFRASYAPSTQRPGAKQSIFNAPLMEPDPDDTSMEWTEEDERQDQESLRKIISKMTPEKRAKWEAERIAEGSEVYRGDWSPERLAAWEADRLAKGLKIWRDGR